MKTLRYQLLVVIAIAVASFALDDDEQLERDEIIEAVNREQTTWKAGRNFNPSFKKSFLKNLLGLKRRPEGSSLSILVYNDDDDLVLPESFDARQKWSKCAALQTIRDQGPCGSCWAVSSASAFTDRLCIASNASFNDQLSAMELLSCSEGGCNGGLVDLAFQYFKSHGIVTGGDYQSNQGCQPYLFPHCDMTGKDKSKPCLPFWKTPKCQTFCYNKLYKKHPFKEDHHRVKEVFEITDIRQMQKEIYRNGPIVAGFDVYDDFFSYKTGVYYHKNGTIQGGHAVKVIGWGVEAETPFWLVANSWNSSWGDKGFFKIKRGNNECNFEESMVGGYPAV